MSYSIRRTIEIDMGHRVHTHGSKCWNLHGHRYVIEAEVRSIELQHQGHQTGMVMDFGFLKEFMMQQIHNFCDHGLCMSIDDPWLARMLPFSSHLYDRAKEVVASEGWYHVEEHRKDNQTKLLIIPFIPTAENLAEFWFKRLKLPITQYHPNVTLEKMYVWETPNSVAIYPTRATPYAEV